MKKVTAFVSRTPEKLSQRRKAPRLPLILVALVAGMIGTYALIHSLAASDLLFNGTKTSDYLNQSAPGAVTMVPDPLGSGQTVFKMTVNNADVAPITPTENPRAELVSPQIITSGKEYWVKTKFLLPNDFPSSVPQWMDMMEIFGPPFSGSSPWQVDVKGSNILWQRNATYGYDIPWSMPILKGQWINILLHERFASDGFVEMWVNGQPVTFFPSGSSNPHGVSPTQRLAMQTMDSSNNSGANEMKIMQYRAHNMFSGSITTYSGPAIIGATRAAVDAADAANGGTQTPPPPPPTDTTAPTVTMAAPANGATVSGKATTVTANASDNVGIVGVQFKLDGNNLQGEEISAPYSIDWDTTTATNGSHTILAIARDATGNTKTSSSITVNVNNVAPDTTPPDTTISTKPASTTTATDATFSFSSSESGSSFECKLDTAAYSACTSPLTYHNLSINSHAFAVRAKDGAGNIDASPATYAWTVTPIPDTSNPTVAFNAPSNGATVSGTVTATVSASDNDAVSKVEISLDGSLKMVDSTAPYNYSFDSKLLTNGSHTLVAKAYDAAGNTQSSTVTFTVNNADTTPPNSPTNLTGTAPTPTTVNLSWTAASDTGINPSGIAKYNVLRNGVVIAQPTTTSYTDSTAVANTTYTYVVQAVDGAGNTSSNSNTASVKTPANPTPPAVDTTAPTVPGNLHATAISTSQVNLGWNASTDNASGIAGYNVYRDGNKLNTTLVTTVSYGDSTVVAGRIYNYKVEAVDGAGNKSAQTTAVVVTIPSVIKGDITGANGAPDGKIDLQDLSFVIRKYNTNDTTADITGPNGTPDGKVDIYDLSYVIRNYQR